MSKDDKVGKYGKPVQRPRSSAHRWHAVTIATGVHACTAVEACKGKRFLSRDAPRLPLPDCTAPECHCIYRHYPDRRKAERRGDELARPAPRGENRRLGHGRRMTDG